MTACSVLAGSAAFLAVGPRPWFKTLVQNFNASLTVDPQKFVCDRTIEQDSRTVCNWMRRG